MLLDNSWVFWLRIFRPALILVHGVWRLPQPGLCLWGRSHWVMSHLIDTFQKDLLWILQKELYLAY